MSRMPPFTGPPLLGFDAVEKMLEHIARSNDGYPPYNIARLPARDGGPELLRITLAVAGFSEADIEIAAVENQLIIRGRQQEQTKRDFLYRGIASRQFQRVFLLSEGMQVSEARLRNGLLSIDLIRPEKPPVVRKINICVPE